MSTTAVGAPRPRHASLRPSWVPAALAALLLTTAPRPVTAAVEPSPPVYGVRLEQAWIPMKDGVRLAATLYMPDGARQEEKFPALLEYLPYRKDDGTFGRDYPVHTWFAKRGYVSVRVDIRGTGRSDGRPPDREYSDQEQLDGMEVIAWLARQPWSNGKVGMFGISWGAFNSIQQAGRRAPALKAILAVEGTEDLFQDDIHYIDGMFHVDEYELSMDLQPAIPPHPDYSLDERMLPRFDNPPWSLLYKRQQRDGPFWERASLRHRYEAIQIPCFLIAGYYDGYRDSVPRMLEHVKAPVKAIIGPWNHTLPHDAVPGPGIEWRHEAVRWWDYWLKGRDTGIMDEPRVAVYVRHWYAPDLNLQEIPGEWRTEEGWPLKRAQNRTLHLQPDHTLADAAGPQAVHDLKYVPSTGGADGFWWGDLTPDQRPADAFSLVYDSAPLTEEMEILGFPKALLQASASAPLANWFARLSDVAPDGTVTQVAGAGMSGAQRDSAESPAPLEPGKVYPLEVEMHFTSWVFPRGHHIRLAISNAAWPMIWPTPYPMTTSLRLGGSGGSRLLLPVVPHEDRPRPKFMPPQPSDSAPGVRAEATWPGTWPGTWVTHRDESRQASKVEWAGSTATEWPWGRGMYSERLTYDVQDEHPEAASVLAEAETSLNLKDRLLTWRVQLEVRSDLKNFYYRCRRELLKGGLPVREKTWQETIPRDHH